MTVLGDTIGKGLWNYATMNADPHIIIPHLKVNELWHSKTYIICYFDDHSWFNCFFHWGQRPEISQLVWIFWLECHFLISCQNIKSNVARYSQWIWSLDSTVKHYYIINTSWYKSQQIDGLIFLQFVHFSQLGHFRSRVCDIETRHRTLKTNSCDKIRWCQGQLLKIWRVYH